GGGDAVADLGGVEEDVNRLTGGGGELAVAGSDGGGGGDVNRLTGGGGELAVAGSDGGGGDDASGPGGGEEVGVVVLSTDGFDGDGERGDSAAG
ncbi:hypothetical protein MARPO_0064s0121, partial [Marchantia polymorpha]